MGGWRWHPRNDANPGVSAWGESPTFSTTAVGGSITWRASGRSAAASLPCLSPKNWTNPTRDSTQSCGPVSWAHYIRQSDIGKNMRGRAHPTAEGKSQPRIENRTTRPTYGRLRLCLCCASVVQTTKSLHNSVFGNRRKSFAIKVVGATGFEPATSWSRTKRSSQAELRPEAF